MSNIEENAASLELLQVRLDEVSNSPEKLDAVQPHPFTASEKRSRQASNKGRLAIKTFKSRPSVGTELLEISHIRAIHNTLIALFLLFLIRMIITELRNLGTYDVFVQGFKFGFYANLHTTLEIFFGMHFVTILCVYPVFSFWATYRQTFQTGSAKARLDCFTLVVFLIYLNGFIFIPATLMWKHPLPPGSGFAVALEQCRLIMKVYAFVRSNAPRALHFKTQRSDLEKCEDDDRVVQKSHSFETPCPEYSKYLYFLYAPTLIYMDSYPRTERIRWTCLAWNIAQLLGSMWFGIYIFVEDYNLYFSKIGHPEHPMSFGQFVQHTFSLMPSAFTLLILGSVFIIHALQNTFAEILRFGDRQFYKDWWNCSSFPSFLRSWNTIVYEWMYIYVLKDAVEFGLGRIHFAIPSILVLFISAIAHEYIIFISLNFILPALLPLFGGVGLASILIKYEENAFGNFMAWMGLIVGAGILYGVYGFELSARWKCTVDERSTWDFLKPRLLSASCTGFGL